MAAASSDAVIVVEDEPEPDDQAKKLIEVVQVLKRMYYRDLKVLGQGGFGIACSSVMGLGECKA